MYMKENISYLKQKLVEGIREKHKASLSGRIKKKQDEILNLKNKKVNFNLFLNLNNNDIKNEIKYFILLLL